MSRYPLLDRRQLELRHLAERGSDMTMERLLQLARPQSLFAHPEFDELVRAVVTARQANRPVIVMMGGHPIKLGLSRFLICRSENGSELFNNSSDPFVPCVSR